MSPNYSAMSPDALLKSMVDCLPSRAADDEVTSSQSPIIKDAYAATGLFGHVCMLAAGFRLVGLGEDDKIGACKVLDFSSPSLLAG
jgi:hypothetical protein